MRSFRIVQRNQTLAVYEAKSDLAALRRFAAALGLDPSTITGTYRLPACGSDEPYVSPIYATEV
jgi:hypothetical protein